MYSYSSHISSQSLVDIREFNDNPPSGAIASSSSFWVVMVLTKEPCNWRLLGDPSLVDHDRWSCWLGESVPCSCLSQNDCKSGSGKKGRNEWKWEQKQFHRYGNFNLVCNLSRWKPSCWLAQVLKSIDHECSLAGVLRAKSIQKTQLSHLDFLWAGEAHNGVRRCSFFIHSLSYTMLTVYLHIVWSLCSVYCHLSIIMAISPTKSPHQIPTKKFPTIKLQGGSALHRR